MTTLHGLLFLYSAKIPLYPVRACAIIAAELSLQQNRQLSDGKCAGSRGMNDMDKVKAFLKRKNIEISVRRYGIDALGAMAQGLFCSLLIGTIIDSVGTQFGIPFLTMPVATVSGIEYTVGGLASAMSGPAMAVAIGYALKCPPLVLFSLITVGFASNALGGAAVAGCCAQMVGFAVMSFPENRWGGLVSQGIGTSMLQMGNIVKNPRIWIAPIITSAITGPIATCLFHLEMNGAAVSSGMGTCGLVGQIGVYTGWMNDIAAGAKAAVTAQDWIGLILISFVLPAVLCPLINLVLRRIGWVKDGDMTLS